VLNLVFLFKMHQSKKAFANQNEYLAVRNEHTALLVTMENVREITGF